MALDHLNTVYVIQYWTQIYVGVKCLADHIFLCSEIYALYTEPEFDTETNVVKEYHIHLKLIILIVVRVVANNIMHGSGVV